VTKAGMRRVAALRAECARLEAELASLPPRARWSETVLMSAGDESARVVVSRVVSEAGASGRERSLRLSLAAARASLARAQSEAALFADAAPDGRSRRMLVALYLEDPPCTLAEFAAREGVSACHMRHVHADFWRENNS